MIFVGGTGSKSKLCGEFYQQQCRACGEVHSFSLMRTYSYVHAFYIPVCKYDNHYYLLCSSCGAVYEIPAEAGRTLERNPEQRLDPDLMQLRSSQRVSPTCPACGAEPKAGSAFCHMCGQKL